MNLSRASEWLRRRPQAGDGNTTKSSANVKVKAVRGLKRESLEGMMGMTKTANVRIGKRTKIVQSLDWRRVRRMFRIWTGNGGSGPGGVDFGYLRCPWLEGMGMGMGRHKRPRAHQEQPGPCRPGPFFGLLCPFYPSEPVKSCITPPGYRSIPYGGASLGRRTPLTLSKS